MEAKDLRPLYLKRRLQLLQNKGGLSLKKTPKNVPNHYPELFYLNRRSFEEIRIVIWHFF